MSRIYKYFANTNPMVQLLMLLIMVVVFLFVGSFVSFLFLPLFSQGTDLTEALLTMNDNISFMRFMQALSQVFCMLLPALLFAFMFHSDVVDFFKLRFARTQIVVSLIGCVAFVAIIPVIDIVTQWNNALHLPESMSDIEQYIRNLGLQSEEMVAMFLEQDGGILLLLANIVVMAVVPAVCEEFIFRGAMQQTCAKWFGNHHWAILLTAAVFSIIHFDLFNFMPRFLMGLLLGYIYYYSGTIWASVMAHFTNNALVVFMYYFFGAESVEISTPGQANVWLILASVVLTSIVLCFGIKEAKKLNNKGNI